MKSAGSFILILFLSVMGYQCRNRDIAQTRILVITGGHGYDTSEFYLMFESFEGIDFKMSEKPEAWAKLKAGEEYDALVFYDMWQEISEQEIQVFLQEFEKGTGIIFMHHSLCAHQEWPGYQQLVGGKYHMPEYNPDSSNLSDYMHDITLHVEVLDPEHPVTEGITNFDILDEGYSNISRMPGIHPLLQTDHPDCDRIVAWTHEFNNSKVVYLMGGHDRHAYENESFMKLVSNAIRWTAMAE